MLGSKTTRLAVVHELSWGILGRGEGGLKGNGVLGSGYNEVLALRMLNVVDYVELERCAKLPESVSAPHPVVVALSFQACLRAYMRTSTCACVWTCMHTYAQTCICACTCICARARVHAHAYSWSSRWSSSWNRRQRLQLEQQLEQQLELQLEQPLEYQLDRLVNQPQAQYFYTASTGGPDPT